MGTMRHIAQVDPDAPMPRLCEQIDPELWYDPTQANRARKICKSGCPAMQQCAEEALAIEEDERWSYGVRGGMYASERRRVIRQRREGAA